MKIKIKKTFIGKDYPCFVIAEVGINHNGSVEWALNMIRQAKRAGANAVKIQSFKTAKFMHKDNCEFNNIKSLELSYPDQEKLFRFAKKNNIVLFSTPEDYESADFLEKMGVPAYKIASMDMDYYPFIEYIAKKHKPVILSTGMSSLADIRETLRIIYKAKNRKVILLHCISNYPTDPKDANLKAILTMKNEFQLPVGFSDHTVGNAVSFAAVALGADIIEKHFTLDKNLPGDDHISSANPQDLKSLIEGIRGIETALGDGIKRPCKNELRSIKLKKRGLYANTAIKRGDLLTIEKINFLCPGKGILAADFQKIIGKSVKTDISPGEPILWQQIR